MVTQKDVADKAGVSFITVSRVINNLGNVKPETRTKVELAIKELNYQPNRQAQALNNGLTHTFAFVTPHMYELPLFNNYYVTNILSGVAIKARALGWDILLTTDFDHKGDFDFLRVWRQRKVDGLIFLGFKAFPGEQLGEIEKTGIPCVSISDRISSPAVSWVDADNKTAIEDAVLRLQTLGHKRFAYLGVNPSLEYNPDIRDREFYIREFTKQQNIPLDVFQTQNSKPYLKDFVHQYMDSTPRATGIIAGNDAIAFSFLKETKILGLKCPEDFSIIGFDAEPAGRILYPTLASYSQPFIEMGQMATQMLINQLQFKTAKQSLPFQMTFVPGESIR